MLEKKDLEMIAEVIAQANKPIHERLDKIDSRLDKVEVRLDKVEARLDHMEARLDNMEARLDNMDSRLDNMDSRFDKVEARLDKVEAKVTEVQMTLENETNKNISIIAEGHLDLSRKLDDALKAENEKVMLLIRVTRLENEIRRIKQRIEEIA